MNKLYAFIPPLTKKRCFLVMILLIFVLANMLKAEDTLTLKKALALSLKNNFSIIMEKNSSTQAQNNLILGIGYLLPQINTSATVNRSWETNMQISAKSDYRVTRKSASNAAINANWTLFDGFRMFRGKELLQVTADLAEEQEKITIEQSVIALIGAYCNVVLQQELVALASEQVVLSQQRHEREKNRAQLGRAGTRAVLNAEVLLNSDKSFFEQQQLILKQGQNNLNLILGRDPHSPITVVTDIMLPEMKYKRENLEKKIINRNSSLKLLELRIKTSELDLAIKKAAFSPILSATGSYTYNYAHSDNKLLETTRENRGPTIGLNLQWPLLNGFSRKVAVQNAKLAVENSHLAKQEYKLQLQALVQQRWNNVTYTYRQVEFDRKAMDLARQNVTISSEMFHLGKLTGLAFREAQLGLQNAARNYLNSMVRARVSMAELEQLLGTIRVD